MYLVKFILIVNFVYHICLIGSIFSHLFSLYEFILNLIINKLIYQYLYSVILSLGEQLSMIETCWCETKLEILVQ